MAAQLEVGKTFHFQRVQIFKSQSLGKGSYGTVYQGRLDQLPCAGKLLHKSLLRGKDARIEKHFEKDCLTLSNIRHPNIVQYLGAVIDRETGLPVILMELMDGNLTHFLERSQVPLHLEVNICQDVSLAIAYLHSNSIVHRDLTSNNVLLVANSRAKVSDFGMSTIRATTHRMTKVYLPPEALTDPPVRTNKVDCFSIGVLGIQIMTRKFPEPGPVSKPADVSRSKAPVVVAESECRKSHIALIDPTHPLLAVALRCLCNNEKERPSATELCRELTTLKESPQYIKSIQEYEKRNKSMESKDREIAELQKQVTVQVSAVEDLREKLQTQMEQSRKELGSQMQQKTADTELEVQLLKQENEHLRKENEHLQKENHQIKKQKQQLRQENFQMKQDNQQAQQENEQLRFDLEDVMGEVQQQQTTVSAHEREVKQVRHQLKEQNQLVVKREKEIVELKQQVHEVMADMKPVRDRENRVVEQQMRHKVGTKPDKMAAQDRDDETRKESVPDAKEIQPMKADNSVESKESKPYQQSKWLTKQVSTEFQESSASQKCSASQKRSQFAVQFQQSPTEREKDFQVSISPQVQRPYQQPIVKKEDTPMNQATPTHSATPTGPAKPQRKRAPTCPAKPQYKRSTPTKQQPAPRADKMRLVWSTSEKAPCQMSRGSSTVESSITYLRPSGSNIVHTYDMEIGEWSRVPECPLEYFSLAVLKGQLTAIGGKLAGKPTNFLLSLIMVGSVRTWAEHFPSMPTKRYYTATVQSGQSLVVAGGIGDGGRLSVIEVMDIDTLQWSSAANVPHTLSLASATICGENLYLLGGLDELGNATKSVHTCSLSALIQSCQTSSQDSGRVWHEIADTPVYETTCTTFCGRLLTFGGRSMDYNLSAAVHMYNPEMNTWHVISEMMMARYRCLIAVLPQDKLIVVGGHSSFGVTNATEIASVL